MLQKLEYVLARWAAWHMHMHAEFTFTSELPFASLERVLVLNVSHENNFIFMWMNVQVTYIFIPIVLQKDLFCYRVKSNFGIGLFIHELLREPLILKDHGGKFLLYCNFNAADLPSCLPNCYRECFEVWCNLSAKPVSSREQALNQLLWNDQFLRIEPNLF